MIFAIAMDGMRPDVVVADAADTLAHESVHVAASFLGVKGELHEEETRAYRLGACARFLASGTLRRSDMVRTAFSDESLPRNISVSASAAVASLDAFDKYFGADGTVVRGSSAGALLEDECEVFIQDAFGKSVATTAPAPGA